MTSDWLREIWQRSSLPSQEAILRHHARLEVMSCLWIVAWISSAIFHTRDTWLTERLDYNSGNIAMGYMVYLSVARGVPIIAISLTPLPSPPPPMTQRSSRIPARLNFRTSPCTFRL